MKTIILLLLILPQILFSQSSIGLSIGIQNSLYNTEYNKVLDFPSCCPMFFSPVSNSLLLGLSHTYLINDEFNLFSTIQYSNVKPSTSSIYSYPILKDNTVQNVDFEYTSTFSFHQLDFSTGIDYILSTHFSIGSRFGVVTELSTTYSQTENILTEGVQFTNPTFEQISNQSINNSVFKGIWSGFILYKTPVNKEINFTARLEVATIFDNNLLPINVPSFISRLLVGIDVPLDKNTKTSPLNPEK